MGGGEDDEDINEEKKNDTEVEVAAINPILELLPLPPFITKEQSPLSIEVSCINPRGKFTLILHKNGIVLTNPKKAEEVLAIPAAAVSNVIWFRKMEEYKQLKQPSGKKPLPGHVLLTCFKEDANVVFRNKKLSQVCLQLPTYSECNESDGQFTEKQWWDGLSKALCGDEGSMTRVNAKMDRPSFETDEFTFQSEGASGSSTTTEGMPYVGCYHGLNDGVLYPLREGLLFFKPPLFVHRSKLASISCGRGSGSASRYVDMAVQLDSEERIEFTNIAREELGVLNDYIHKTLIPAMQVDATGVASDKEEDAEEDAVAVEVIVEDGDESEQEKVDAETESSGSKRRRPSRAASRTAREATRAHFDRGVDEGSDDDEEDFQSDDGSDDCDSESDGDTDEEAVASSDSEADVEMDTDEENEDEEDETQAKKQKS
ncbi:hypothetical protein ACHAXN_004903 [Cyclotella atomus]